MLQQKFKNLNEKLWTHSTCLWHLFLSSSPPTDFCQTPLLLYFRYERKSAALAYGGRCASVGKDHAQTSPAIISAGHLVLSPSLVATTWALVPSMTSQREEFHNRVLWHTPTHWKMEHDKKVKEELFSISGGIPICKALVTSISHDVGWR